MRLPEFKLLRGFLEKLRGKSVRFILLTPWLFVIFYFMLASQGVGFIVRNHLSDYATGLAQKKMEAMDTTLKSFNANLHQAIDYQRYSDYFKGLTLEMHPSGLNYSMKRTADGFNIPGYAVLKLNGEIAASHNPDIFDRKSLERLIEWVLEHDYTDGYAHLYKTGYCQFAAAQIVVGDKPTCVVLYVGYSSDNLSYLDHHKMQHQVEFLTFDNNKFVCSTDTLVTEAELNEGIITTTCEEKNKWVGKLQTENVGYIASAIPFFSYDTHETVSTLVIGINDSLINDPIRSIRLLLILAVIGAIIIVILVVWVTNEYITRPIKYLTKASEIIATGNLGYHIEDKTSASEIVALNRALNDMKHKIRDVVSPIVTYNETIVNTINQVSASSAEISSAANRQAASLEEISSSMEEMGANIQNNMNHAVDTNKISDNMQGLIKDLGDSSKKSFDAINNIAENIVSINGLVKQTNILALNASIEAARAGEHGKGFAVVAKEVGYLAGETHDTADAIAFTANQSVAESEIAYQNVKDLLPKIEQITALIKEIATASVEQNAGVNQVNSAINDLNNLTQSNAASSEELAANAHELQKILHVIADSVRVFKL